MNRKHRKWILSVILLAILLRLGLLIIAFIHPERTLATDSQSYLQPAQAILETGYYSFPNALRVPTYPAFIALVYVIFGENPVYIALVQMLLGIGTIYITYRLGLLLGISQTASITGALILSLSLETLFSSFFVLTETLFTLLLVSSTYALVRFIRDGRLIWLVSCGLLTGWVILCRPVAIAYEVVGLGILLLNQRAKLWQRIAHIAVYVLVVFGLFIAPWTFRNKQVVGVPTVTTLSNYYLLLCSAAPLDADLRHVDVKQSMAEMEVLVSQTLAERGLEANEANLYYVRGEIARQILLKDPGRYIFIHLRYDLNMFLPGVGAAVNYLGFSEGSTEGLRLLKYQGIEGVLSNYFSGQALYSLLFLPFIVLLAATYLGVITGAAGMIKKREWFILVVLVLTAGYFLLIPGYGANSRYRVPAMPYLVLIAGPGLTMLWNSIKAGFHKTKKHDQPAA